MSFEVILQQNGPLEIIIPGGIGPLVETTTIIATLNPGHNVVQHNRRKMPRLVQIWDNEGYMDTIRPSLKVDDQLPYSIHVWVSEEIQNCRIEIIHW